VNIVRDLNCPVVKGNHDEMASMDEDLIGFNPLAEEAINWTRSHLTTKDKEWLRELKLVRQVRDFTIVHATLDTPHKWGYVFNQLDAAASFNYQHTQLCFYGHTHSPRAYIRDGTVRSALLDKLQIEPGKKYFVNVGSVGQPRDGDWRAAYCLYTPLGQTVELRRIEYDIWATQEKNAKAGLPQGLRRRDDDDSPPDSPGEEPPFSPAPKRPRPPGGTGASAKVNEP
jgi:diadenosine tetraphosphatase ApaH/serine/threonine PP2A family protein phosphatase